MERFDFGYPPFDSLTASQRARFQAAVDIVFFDDDETIISPDEATDRLFVVMKGLVKEVAADGEVAAVYHAHDTFDARALVQGSSPNRFVAAEQALLYAVSKEAVLEAVAENSRFGAFFYTSVAEKFSSLAGRNNEEEFAGLFAARVRDACRRQPVWLDGGADMLAAAEAMRGGKSKSALLRHEGRVGLLTESVFRNLLTDGGSGSDAAHRWATFDLISIDINDFVFHALLKMMEHHIQRVVVTENGEAVAILEQIDVLAYLSNHSHLVAQRLERAQTLDELADIAAQMNRSIRVLHRGGAPAVQLARLMQVLNGSLFEKAWRMIAPPEIYRQSCLLVMGSEGRGEQVLKTDQDNALVMREGIDQAAAEAACLKFSETLASFGYPPCQGGIMVSNPEWRRTLPEFKQTVSGWLRHPDGTAMMNLAIFLDARAVAGDAALFQELRAHLRQYLNNDAGMLMTFARAVGQFDGEEQGIFGQWLRRDTKQQMDIKKLGLFPVIHGVRALALEAHLDETNTFDRLQQLVRRHILEAELAQDIAEALRYLMEMRLKAGLLSWRDGRVTAPNRLAPDDLSTLERDLLKDALQVVKRFKNVVRFHFRINS